MEDRLASSTIRRPGPASIALVVILVTTAAWWTLALWPVGDFPPAWLVSTRAVCFGARAGGPPNFGGWLFLIGEPLGLLVMLTIIGGKSLAADLAGMRYWLERHWVVRAVAAAVVLVTVVAAASLAARPTRGIAAPLSDGRAQAINLPAPATTLVDQHGAPVMLSTLTQPSIVTVAFSHCDVVCPTTVRHILSARIAAGRPTMPLFIVTVDPWRDTAERLPTIARQWELGATDHVLSGTVGDVEQTLDALNIGRSRDPDTGDIAHAVVVLLLDGRGRVTQRFDGSAGGLAQALAAEPPRHARALQTQHSFSP